MRLSLTVLASLSLIMPVVGAPQAGRPPLTPYFTREEFAARRARIFDAIGPDALAIVQGAPSVHSSAIFRQSNEFFYLTRRRRAAGVSAARRQGPPQHSVPAASATNARAQTEGELLSSDDPAAAVAATGIDEVRPIDDAAPTI